MGGVGDSGVTRSGDVEEWTRNEIESVRRVGVELKMGRSWRGDDTMTMIEGD